MLRIHCDDFGRNLIVGLEFGGGPSIPAAGAVVELAQRMQGVPTTEALVSGYTSQKIFLGPLHHLVADRTPIDCGAVLGRPHRVDPVQLTSGDPLGNALSEGSKVGPESYSLRLY